MVRGFKYRKRECEEVHMLSFNFILRLNFYFPLVLGKVVYDNEFKTKGNKNKTKDKIEPQQIYHKQRPHSNSDNDA